MSTHKAWVVAVANQKGGVAKTTSVGSLGTAFAEQGLAVLLVDLDPQACLTFSLGIDPEAVEGSVHQVLLGERQGGGRGGGDRGRGRPAARHHRARHRRAAAADEDGA